MALFTPHCDIPDEASRAHRFKRGLRINYKSFMTSHDRNTLEEVHEGALRLEREAADARHRSDFRAIHEADDGSWKRQHQRQYHQPEATALPLFATLPEAASSAPLALASILPAIVQLPRHPIGPLYMCKQHGHHARKYPQKL